MKLRQLASYGPAFVLTASIFLSWELYVRAGLINVYVLPAPSAVLQALVENWDVLLGHTIQTALETVLGLMAATLLGLCLAVVLDLSTWIRKAVYPLLVISQTIPMIALAPLLVIWFGLDLGPKVIVVTLYCFFPIAVSVADGLAGVDPDLIRLMQSMRASRWQILWLVRLPAALPSFFSGLRIAATYSMTGAIFGEYVAAYQGLGLYMKTAANAHAIVIVFAAIFVTAFVSLLLFSFVNLIEWIALPWYHASRSKPAR
ncbi:ABC transporter permease [Tengunoibacter tsumagoiensis]|uniref:ABC transporter permease n=1 Tax=Tengunoibacter tsumagoiensis TaxID=2014871 RepID=A0A402AAL1_9CHLR|nr:ABC transporter permease [Tengunoibacter tsumagoiensis]GCE16138.1 ABC transporter permease [Tengunoibacter tsumagoiensis]